MPRCPVYQSSGDEGGGGADIAIVDDELRLAAAAEEEAVERALAGLVGEGSSLVTLYYGAETSPAQAEALAEQLRERYSAYEVEVVFGGQPHYQYIVSLE